MAVATSAIILVLLICAAFFALGGLILYWIVKNAVKNGVLEAHRRIKGGE